MDTKDMQASLGFEGPVREGQYLRVDDFDMWVENSGDGPPLLMLNGGFGQTDMPAATALAKAYGEHFTVYAFDARGHGRSGFGAGPITYAREAADAVALLDVLGLEDAHIYGHSDGGCVSLHLLFDYPHRIRTSTLSGTPYHQDVYNEMAKGFVKEFPKTLAAGEQDEMGFQDMLQNLGMSPGKISRLGEGLSRGWSTTPTFRLEMLAEFKNPVLVIEAGADEFIDVKHFTEMTEAIPNATGLSLLEMTHDPAPFVEEAARASAVQAQAYEKEQHE
ncbi:MAG: alpha/beta hydrolase [Pseudomonadales bacterium]|nr:alpha/beta hydrolase [Pseudomonadales bacterium]